MESKRISIDKKIVEAVLEVLSGRKGFDWWWEEIDSQTKREIKLALRKAIANTMKEADSSAAKLSTPAEVRNG
jgi:hypothetical protein